MMEGKESDSGISAEEIMLQKHRKEKKDLQGAIQKIKHSIPKGNAKLKKESQTKISAMEAELEARHHVELEELKTSNSQSDARDNQDSNEFDSVAVDEDRLPQKKPSKAQRRREKKEALDRERTERIDQQEVENLTGARNVEAEKLKEKLAARNLTIREVVSDGNCLYAAVEDQLKQRRILSSVTSLRQQTAAYIRNNPDEFLAFLCKPDTGEPYTKDEFDQYCHKIASTAEWGGQLEINALASVLMHPIEVVQADAPSIVQGEEFESEPLTLTYHRHTYSLGEHYNSTCPKPRNEDAEFS